MDIHSYKKQRKEEAEKMQEKIFSIHEKNPSLTYREIADMVGIHTNSVGRILRSAVGSRERKKQTDCQNDLFDWKDYDNDLMFPSGRADVDNSTYGIRNVGKRKFIAISPEGETFEFQYLIDAAMHTGVSKSSISSCVCKRYKQMKGWRFKKIA